MRELNVSNFKLERIHKDSNKSVLIYRHKNVDSNWKVEILSKDLKKNSHFLIMGRDLNVIDEWTGNQDYKMPKWILNHISKSNAKAKKARDTSLYGKLVAQSKEFNEDNDCTVKAVAAAANISYADSHALLKRNGRKSRTGMYHWQYVSAVKNDLGREVVEMHWVDLKNLAKTIGCKNLTMNNVMKVLDKNKNYLVNMRGHVAGVHKGEMADWSNGRKFKVISIVEVKA